MGQQDHGIVRLKLGESGNKGAAGSLVLRVSANDKLVSCLNPGNIFHTRSQELSQILDLADLEIGYADLMRALDPRQIRQQPIQESAHLVGTQRAAVHKDVVLLQQLIHIFTAGDLHHAAQIVQLIVSSGKARFQPLIHHGSCGRSGLILILAALHASQHRADRNQFSGSGFCALGQLLQTLLRNRGSILDIALLFIVQLDERAKITLDLFPIIHNLLHSSFQ